MSTVFFTLDEVLAIHADQIDSFGGSHGLRDAGLLESAVAMPQAGFGGELLHPTLAEQAAAYLFHLAKNHPFVDGNKRVALAVALTFLRMNGVQVHAPVDEIAELTERVAGGEASKAEVAVYLDRNARGVRGG